MASTAAEVFMDRWMNDPTFPHQVESDPKAALVSCGIKPEEQLVNSLKGLKSGAPVEELQKRVSKSGAAWGRI